MSEKLCDDDQYCRFRECPCAECRAKCLEPESGTYYIVSRGRWRYPLSDEGREETFGTIKEAEEAIHERFTPHIDCYVEKVERTRTIVFATHSFGPKKDRREFWVKAWTRYSKTRSGRSLELRERVAQRVAAAILANEEYLRYYRMVYGTE